MARDTGGNIVVDFVWGNIPMQPDDDRVTPLDPNLDSHIIATSQYNGFPGNTPVFPYLDTTGNVTVPNVVGLTESAATTALTAVDLVKGAVTNADNYAGATSVNNGKIKSQSPAAGAKINEGNAVALVKFVHTP